MKTTKFTLFFVILTSVAFAQDYSFKVLANKGSNEVKSGADWVPLKTGASLKSGDELKLSDNAYLGLVHSSGKPLEVKKAGSYKVAMLESQIKAGSGVLTKYTDFILSSNSPEASKNKLSATGAVNRGNESQGAIKVRLPGNQNAGIFNNLAIVSWDGASAPGPYTITLRNMFDDELATYETPETSFQINLNDAKISKESVLQVEVKSKSNTKLTSRQYLIKKLAPAQQEAVKKSLAEISSEVSEETALNKFILAGFYEQESLYIDAVTAFEQSIKLAPDVTAYKDAYDEFLQRHGMR